MPDFRVFPIGPDGHFTPPEEHFAPSDEVILNLAAGKDFPHGAEVWDGARLVGLIQKSGSTPRDRKTPDPDRNQRPGYRTQAVGT